MSKGLGDVNMNLVTVYKAVEQSIVAFAPKYAPLRDGEEAPEFPPIFGTGFVVGDGLIATNDHVVRAFVKMPRPPGAPADDWPVLALLPRMIAGEGWGFVPMEVVGASTIETFQTAGHYYGPRKPDLAFVHVNVRNLPTVAVSENAIALEVGADVATAGFGMGTDVLAAPGYLHQFTPTLQKGIISAVLPFPCQKPHAVMLNVMTQGGASGSPVFEVDRGVVGGVLYGALIDFHKGSTPPHWHSVPTNFSYFVPGWVLMQSLELIHEHDAASDLLKGAPTLDELIASLPRRVPEAQAHLKDVGKTSLLASNLSPRARPQVRQLDPTSSEREPDEAENRNANR